MDKTIVGKHFFHYNYIQDTCLGCNGYIINSKHFTPVTVNVKLPKKVMKNKEETKNNNF